MGVYTLATTKRKKARAARAADAAVATAHASDATMPAAAAVTPHDDASTATRAGDDDSATIAAATVTRVEYSEPAQWVERMALTSTRSLPADVDADDDPRREEAFIQQALLSVMRGIALLEQAEVPWRRPEDYYAEMYKDDVHMNHVRRAMEAAKARIEAQAHRRAMKDQKSYGKEVQAEVLRQRARYKREMQTRLNEWRQKKKRAGGGAAGDEDTIDDVLDDGRGAGGRGYGGGSRGGRGGRGGARPMRTRSLQPGGKSRRPGKNARRRRGA